MQISYNSDRKVLDSDASDFFAYHTKNILNSKDLVLWAMPGGRSVSGIFRSLANRDDIPWGKIHFFMIDERLVPTGDIESNYRLLHENLTGDLLKKGKISTDNIHPFIFKPGDNDQGSGGYEEELKRFGKYFDIILLSSGEDCHIAGIYPGHHSVKNKYKYFFTMDDSPKPPKDRMSSSRTLLLKSTAAVLLFYGDSKKSAFTDFLDSNINETECPAKIVAKINYSLILTDQKK
ncbi:MAG: 6-phosphogluconolactonase [Candidatus Humimicrobiaceae bacterium]